MHWIERHILKQLSFSDSQRYSQLKPDSVDGNLFQYHARALEKQALITRTKEGYCLSQAGKIFVADLSQTKLMNQRKLPRAIVMVACRNANGEYLLFKWRRQPYRNLISLPFGRQLYDTSTTEIAAEQLLLKTGYTAQLSFFGHTDVIVNHPEKITDHMAINVFIGTNLTQSHTPDGLTGTWFWGQPSDQSDRALVPGFKQIIAWLEDSKHAHLIEIRIDDPGSLHNKK